MSADGRAKHFFHQVLQGVLHGPANLIPDPIETSIEAAQGEIEELRQQLNAARAEVERLCAERDALSQLLRRMARRSILFRRLARVAFRQLR